MDLIGKYLMNDIGVLLNCIDEAILIVDREGTILEYNKAFSTLTDFNGRSFIGRNLKDIIASGLLRESAALKSIELGKKVDMNQIFEDGQTTTWTYIPVFDEAGHLVLTVGTGRDITKLATLEKKLKLSEMIISQYEDKRFRLNGESGHGEIIYASRKMKQVMNIGWKAAATSSSVLIWGETGVGKEMIASGIHQTSDRSGKPFVAINCASIPDELLESELFGYEEGSFTGARRSGKQGLLEEANGGTLFLDEIGELPLKMQSKLLRFLQEGEFKRIGSNKTQSVDVRILCATNLTLDQLLNSRRFRQDLYYRIAVVPIYVPPLRERKEDIPPLIRHFVRQMNVKYDTDIRIPPRLMNRLYDYDWPGNVRELKNVIERMAILFASQELGEEDLELLINSRSSAAPADRDIPSLPEPSPPRAWGPLSLKAATARFEEELIRQACRTTGSIIKAAQALGINPSTIHRKLKKPPAVP